MLQSCLCTEAQLRSPDFQAWATRMKEDPHFMHRKLWEYCYIAQALAERQLLRPGMRGLGFAVGQEPLPSLFASLGCDIVATDLDEESDQLQFWTATGQHASHLDALNVRGICTPEELAQRVTFRPVNMNAIPADLCGFDFLWSCSSLEHLGGLDQGRVYIYNALKCLKPGGFAIHTTDFNISSNTDTLSAINIAIYRKDDIEDIASSLTLLGHSLAARNYATGNDPVDLLIDQLPYEQPHGKERVAHLKFWSFGYVTTSIGLIIQKSTMENEQSGQSATGKSADSASGLETLPLSNDLIKIGAPDVDVERVMTQIRDNIKRHRLEAEMRGIDFDKLAQGKHPQLIGERFGGEVYDALYDAQVGADKHVTAMAVSPRPIPIIGGLIRRVREALHALVLFYVNRSAQRQAGFNVLVTKTLTHMVSDLEKEAEADTKEKRIAELERRIAELEKQLSSKKTE